MAGLRFVAFTTIVRILTEVSGGGAISCICDLPICENQYTVARLRSLKFYNIVRT